MSQLVASLPPLALVLGPQPILAMYLTIAWISALDAINRNPRHITRHASYMSYASRCCCFFFAQAQPREGFLLLASRPYVNAMMPLCHMKVGSHGQCLQPRGCTAGSAQPSVFPLEVLWFGPSPPFPKPNKQPQQMVGARV